MPDAHHLSRLLTGLIVLATAAGLVLEGNQQGTVVLLVFWCVLAKPQTPLLARRCMRVWPLPLLAVVVAFVDTRPIWDMDPTVVGFALAALGTGLGYATVRNGSFLHRVLFPPDPTLATRFQRVVAETAWKHGIPAPDLYLRANPAVGLVDVSAYNGTDWREAHKVMGAVESWLERELERASFANDDPLLPHGVGSEGNTMAPILGLVETAHQKLHRLAHQGQT